MNLYQELILRMKNLPKNKFFSYSFLIFTICFLIFQINYLIIDNQVLIPHENFFNNNITHIVIIFIYLFIFLSKSLNKLSLGRKIFLEIYKQFLIYYLFSIIISVLFLYFYVNFELEIIIESILDYSILLVLGLYFMEYFVEIAVYKNIFYRLDIVKSEMNEIKNGNKSKRISVFGYDELDKLFNFTNEILEELEKIIKFEKHHSLIDPLTLCYNRRGLEVNFQAIKNESLREKKELSLAIFDLDNFKKINDTYGHDIGDKVLIEFTKFIKKQLREYDSIYRLGGEEFLILFPNSDKKNSKKILDRINKKVKTELTNKIIEIKNPITFSGGYVNSKDFNLEDPNILDKMIKKSDERLYLAKNTGKDKIIFN